MSFRRPPRDEHTMKVGFVGRGGSPGVSRQVTVDVPAGDLTPWDLDTKFKTVGGRTDRLDAVAKVTGRAKYAEDMRPAGMLYGVLVRATIPDGRLEGLDLDAVRGMPGVRAAIPLKDLGNRVRWVGDPVAAIAADTLDQAYDALARVKAEYTEGDAPIDFRDHENAPALRDGVVDEPWPSQDAAKIEQALADCERTAEGTWICEVQTHSSLEPHGLVAHFQEDDSLEVWASTQAVFGVQSGLARAMGLQPAKVRVHAEFVGGGFGSKFGPDAEGVAAARLSKETGRPVRVLLSRFEEHTCAGNRPSAIMRIRAGVDADGKITAWDYQSWGGPGYAGRGGGTRGVPQWTHAAVTRNSQSDLATATDAGRSMRAPGWPQGNFATEGMLEALASEAGMDSLAFRLLNDPDPLRQMEWRIGAERFGWADRVNPTPGKPREGDAPRILRGAGLAAAFWGQMGRPGNGATCRIHQDGTVEARSGAQDIGTGMKTLMAMLTAEELGIEVAAVKVTMGDSNDPVGPGSGGSTTTPSLAPTVRHAAGLAARQLCERVADALGVAPEKVTYRDGGIDADGKRLSFREACRHVGPNPIEATGQRQRNYEGYAEHICGCQFAEVEVDTHTGVVRVTKMLAVQDCGLVLNEKLAESQVIGAMIQGLSYALHEQRVMDREVGRMLNGDFLHYKVAGPADMPELEAIMQPVANGMNNVGAAGLGEAPAVAAPAAIANAVANALGVPVRHLPITPDKVLAALAKRR